jgi:tetratricopeptide (TPR) repeat protein
MGRVEESIESFRRAIDLVPEDPTARIGYGKALFYTGAYQASLDVLLPEARAADEPLNTMAVDAVGFAGLALAALGRHAEAAGLLSRAVGAAPGQVDLRLGWARALAGSGRDGEAVKVLQRGLDLDARAGRIAVALARVLATSPQDDVRDGQRALRLAEHWAGLTQRSNAAALDALACAYAEVGRFDDAVRASEQALDILAASSRSELGTAISQRLELFRQGKPYHRPALPES